VAYGNELHKDREIFEKKALSVIFNFLIRKKEKRILEKNLDHFDFLENEDFCWGFKLSLFWEDKEIKLISKRN